MVVPRYCSILCSLRGLVFFSRPGMGFVVYLGEMLEVKVGIDLGRGDVGVAEQLLHAAEIVAGLQQVGCKGMAEQVREHVGIDALAPGPMGDPSLYRPATEAPATVADEQRFLTGRRELRTGFVPLRERAQSVAADRHDAVFIAFAGHAHGRIFGIDVAAVEISQLRQSQAR